MASFTSAYFPSSTSSTSLTGRHGTSNNTSTTTSLLVVETSIPILVHHLTSATKLMTSVTEPSSFKSSPASSNIMLTLSSR